jgi:hypothetical protein
MPDNDSDDGAFLSELSASPIDNFEFRNCIAVKDRFPNDVIMEMSKEDPDLRVLYDIVENINTLLVVSEPFKEILQKFDCGDVEYLPVTIRNQRGKIEPTAYFIVNLVDSVDYINKKETKIEFSALKKSLISSIENIIINEEGIPADRALFRSAEFPKGYVVNDALKNAIENANMENVKFVEASEYDSALY